MSILGGKSWSCIKNTRAAKATLYGQRRRKEITGMLMEDNDLRIGSLCELAHVTSWCVIESVN